MLHSIKRSKFFYRQFRNISLTELTIEEIDDIRIIILRKMNISGQKRGRDE